MHLLLACRRLGLFLIYGVYAVDRLPHERPTLANTSIDLLGQDLEALITEKNRLALLRFRKRWDNGQMITRVQGDGLSDHPHIAVEVVKPGVQTVEMLAQQSFDRWERGSENPQEQPQQACSCRRPVGRLRRQADRRRLHSDEPSLCDAQRLCVCATVERQRDRFAHPVRRGVAYL